jgi:hypothetical protein
MANNVFFSEEELEIMSRLLIISVREVIVADGEMLNEEFGPLTFSLNNPNLFPIPIVADVFHYMNEKGPDYALNVMKEFNESNVGDIFYETTTYGKRVLDNLSKKDKSDFLTGFYGLLLETVHADGYKDDEETAASLDIMRSVTDLSLKDVYKMDRTWRKKARRFGH